MPNQPNWMPIIQTKGVSKFYSGRNTVFAVRRAELRVYKGDFVVILGPSGSGKSTLLSLLGGLDRPTSGQIHLGDVAYHQLSEGELTELRRQRIGFIFQYFNLLNTLTAKENVMLPLRLLDMAENERVDRAANFLDRVGLSHRANHLPSKLSGGEQQRVAVARALVHQPDVLLADEPTGNLDSKTGQLIMQLLADINAEYEQTIIVVSHDTAFRRLANRVVYMSDGQIDRIEVKTRGAD